MKLKGLSECHDEMSNQSNTYQFDDQAWLESQGYLNRKLLFLDLNYWIQLSEPRTGSQAEIKDRLSEMVSSGRLICPVSPSLIMELGKQPPSPSRQSLCQLMDELSKGLGLKIAQRIFPIEFEAILGGDAAPRRMGYSHFYDALMESGLVLDGLPNIPEAIARLSATAVLEHQAQMTITDFMNVWFDMGRDEESGPDPAVAKMSQGFSDKAVQANKWKLDNPTASLESIEQAEVLGLLHEFLPDILKIIPRKYTGVPQFTEREFKELLDSCPTFWCIYKGMAATRWGGRVKGNDIWDVLHVGSVTPYVDCLACDRGTRHIYKEMLHANQRFGTIIVSQDGDLLNWLTQIR